MEQTICASVALLWVTTFLTNSTIFSFFFSEYFKTRSGFSKGSLFVEDPTCVYTCRLRVSEKNRGRPPWYCDSWIFRGILNENGSSFSAQPSFTVDILLKVKPQTVLRWISTTLEKVPLAGFIPVAKNVNSLRAARHFKLIEANTSRLTAQCNSLTLLAQF